MNSKKRFGVSVSRYVTKTLSGAILTRSGPCRATASAILRTASSSGRSGAETHTVSNLSCFGVETVPGFRSLSMIGTCATSPLPSCRACREPVGVGLANVTYISIVFGSFFAAAASVCRK